MTEGGFLAAHRPQPVKLALVIGAHAAIIAALMLAVAPRVAHPIDVFTGYNVDNPPSPPPPPVTTKVPPKAGPVSRITTVPPTVVPPTTPDAPIKIVLTPPHDVVPIVPSTIPGPPPTPASARAATPVTVEASVDPRFADALQPPYPPNLLRQGITGGVTVRVLVGADGRVHDVQMVSADDPGFFAATERQARRAWRFRPATRDGVPVESWRTMTVHFVERD